MATDAQISANQRNAALSTGPSSPDGLRASSANATRHGLSGKSYRVAPARAEEAARRRALLVAEIRPATAEGLDAIDRMVVMAIRMEDCRIALEALHVEQAEEAVADWEHARKVEAEATAEGFTRRPGSVAARLGETKQGAELMLGRWESLRRSLDLGTWDESDRSAALDLLGVAPGLRKPSQTPLDAPEGADATAHVRAAIEAEVARLRSRLATVLSAADARSRARAGTASGVLLSKPAALILRYEREAERRFRAALKVACAAPKDDGPPPPLRPGPDRLPPPDPRPEPERAPRAEPDADGRVDDRAGSPAALAAAPAAASRPLNRRGRRAQAARLRRSGR